MKRLPKLRRREVCFVCGVFGMLRANLEAVKGLANVKDKVKALEMSGEACLGGVVDEDGEVIFGWRGSMLEEGLVRVKGEIVEFDMRRSCAVVGRKSCL